MEQEPRFKESKFQEFDGLVTHGRHVYIRFRQGGEITRMDKYGRISAYFRVSEKTLTKRIKNIERKGGLPDESLKAIEAVRAWRATYAGATVSPITPK